MSVTVGAPVGANGTSGGAGVPLLEVRDLSVRIGEKLILDRVSFTLGEGERLGVIGPSGSGKSMLSTAILGLLPGAARVDGSVRLGGVELVGMPEKQRRATRGRDVAMVFQDPATALDPLMRLGDQVAAPLRRHRGLRGAQLRAEVLAALREVALDDPERIAASYPHEVSGGQRQRVAIAMALACRPRLLIADEPTTALDVTVQAQVLDVLDAVARERGTTLLFISHDLPVVARMAPRILLVDEGRVALDAPTVDLVRAPSSSAEAAAGGPGVHALPEAALRIVRAARELDDVLVRLGVPAGGRRNGTEERR